MKRSTLATLMVLTIAQAAFAFAGSKPTSADSEKMVDAIQKQNSSQIEKLKKSGTSINALGPDGLTGLMRVADDGNQDGVNLALKLGADINQANSNGETALFYATYSGHESVALELLKRGAKADLVLPQSKECVLHSAAKASLTRLGRELKKSAPACLAQKNTEGKTPYDLAKEMGASELAKALKP